MGKNAEENRSCHVGNRDINEKRRKENLQKITLEHGRLPPTPPPKRKTIKQQKTCGWLAVRAYNKWGQCVDKNSRLKRGERIEKWPHISYIIQQHVHTLYTIDVFET